MAQQENDAYPPGTIVFAKLKGYPWWPAKIEDEKTVPLKVMKQKTKAKSPLWTVFFFGSRDYGFFGLDSIRPFDKDNVEKDLKAKKFKTKDLEMAVRQALDPTLMEEDGEDTNDDDKAPLEKKKANGKVTPTKKSSKISKASSDEDMDTQSINNGKRGASEDSMDERKRRKSMSVEKENLQSNGNPKENESLEITREFKRLYHLRHRLQKLIYEKEQGSIPLDAYPKISQTLKDVEEAPMTYDLLRHTKIGKVVKCGIAYEFENDTEFNIHERCQQLMRKWKEMFVDSKEPIKANGTADEHNKEPTPAPQE